MDSNMEVILVNSYIFSNAPFTSGNPTMICLVEEKEDHGKSLMNDDIMMQRIASEMNQSVTAFVSIYNDRPSHSSTNNKRTFKDSSHFTLRWFSSTCETNICGHGTLAVSSVLWQLHGNLHSTLYFHTLQCGIFTASNSGSDSGEGSISIDLPVAYSVPTDVDRFSGLVKVIIKDEFTVYECCYCKESSRLLLRLPDGTTRSQLESLSVDTSELMKVNQNEVKGIIVTVKCCDDSEEGGYDFYSRYFAPWWGNPEDHVTGAAHTTLVPYWSNVLGGKESGLRSCQCSPTRGGCLEGSLMKEQGRVRLTGRASIIMKGVLFV